MQNDWISKTLYSNGVLKNKLGIKDQRKLEQTEYLLSAKAALRLLQRKLKIKDINDLNKIHQVMFGSLYDWAGKEREGNFYKGDTEFFPYQRFSFAKEDINAILNSLPEDEPLNKENYAKLLDRINYYHPFREGNGRSTKTFIQCFAAQHHQVIDYPRSNDKMIEAEIDGNIKEIAKLIKVENTPDRDAAYKRLLYLNEKEVNMKNKKL